MLAESLEIGRILTYSFINVSAFGFVYEHKALVRKIVFAHINAIYMRPNNLVFCL